MFRRAELARLRIGNRRRRSGASPALRGQVHPDQMVVAAIGNRSLGILGRRPEHAACDQTEAGRGQHVIQPQRAGFRSEVAGDMFGRAAVLDSLGRIGARRFTAPR